MNDCLKNCLTLQIDASDCNTDGNKSQGGFFFYHEARLQGIETWKTDQLKGQK